MSSSKITTNIHRSCYVYVYVINNFCERVHAWDLFEYKRIYADFFFIIWLYMYWHWTPNYQEWKVGIPLTGLNPPHFWICPKITTWISNSICRSLFYVQWFKVRGDCSHCCHWRNCWWSLFKLSFHKKISTGKINIFLF